MQDLSCEELKMKKMKDQIQQNASTLNGETLTKDFNLRLNDSNNKKNPLPQHTVLIGGDGYGKYVTG